MVKKDLDMTVNIKLHFSWLDAIKLRLAGLKNTSMTEEPEDAEKYNESTFGQSAEEKKIFTISYWGGVADGK